jgi:hypothetical protein
MVVRILKKTIWPHQMRLPVIRDVLSDPRADWLEQRLSPDSFLVAGPWHYCFKHKSDMLMFALVWGADEQN